MNKNKTLSEDLEKLQKESFHITELNKRLICENNQIRRELEIATSENAVIVKRNVTLHNTVKAASEKMKKLEMFKSVNVPLVSTSLEGLPKRERRYTEPRLPEESGSELRDEITDYILQVMQDVKSRSGPWKNLTQDDFPSNCRINDQNIPISLYKLNVKERETVFRFLLQKLHKVSSRTLEHNHGQNKKDQILLPCKLRYMC
jgi:hypothetical protein